MIMEAIRSRHGSCVMSHATAKRLNTKAQGKRSAALGRESREMGTLKGCNTNLSSPYRVDEHMATAAQGGVGYAVGRLQHPDFRDNHHWTPEPCLRKSRGLGRSPRGP
jgi:hypothetical protein